MRITVSLDEELFEKARAFSGISKKGAVFDAVLKALIERESARMLVDFGGSEPELRNVPRRRLNPA